MNTYRYFMCRWLRMPCHKFLCDKGTKSTVRHKKVWPVQQNTATCSALTAKGWGPCLFLPLPCIMTARAMTWTLFCVIRCLNDERWILPWGLMSGNEAHILYAQQICNVWYRHTALSILQGRHGCCKLDRQINFTSKGNVKLSMTGQGVSGKIVLVNNSRCWSDFSGTVKNMNKISQTHWVGKN